jgi:type VI secretion system protein ImpB
MTFESMKDFSPAEVVKKVDGLKQLMEARQQLSNLLSYMDGKQGAEDLIQKVLNDPALLKTLAAKAKEAEPAAAAEPDAQPKEA